MTKMRYSPSTSGVIKPETYHGARMDQKALEFHTQLHEWNEAQKVSAQANKHAQLLTNARQKEVFLPFKKLAHIQHWTKDVNRFYRPYKGGRPNSGNFMKIDVTKYNMKMDKKPEEARSKSAKLSASASANGYRIVSAVSASTGGAKQRFFGTDTHTVNHKLIESHMHYSTQRRDIRSAHVRRPFASAKTMETKTDNTDANLSANINGLDKVEPSDSETLSTFDNTSTKLSSRESQGNCQGQTEGNNLQQKITVRSYSNRMLNVISIDDCKINCRYRPQTIKENRYQLSDSPDGKYKKTIENFGSAHELADDKSTVKKTHECLEGLGTPNSVDKTGNIANGDDSDIKLDIKLNGLLIGDVSEDKNNNNTTTNDDVFSVGEGEDSSDKEHKDSSSDSTDIALRKSKLSKTKSKSTNGHKDSITFQDTKTSECSNAGSNMGKKTDSGSSQTNKTSNGRITSLYTHTLSTDSRNRTSKTKKKKLTRTAKISNAINDMVKDRKVMNSMTRDFDTRTAEFGRTVVDKSEGSELFQKLHSNLRKKMDNFFDTHSAVKTTMYYEAKRRNSVQCQN